MNDNDLEPISLGSADNSPASASKPADLAISDPWAIEESTDMTTTADADMDDFVNNNPSIATDGDTMEAISKLKVSSKRLASNLDQKLGLSQAWDKLGTSVRDVDEKTHVSSTVKSAGTTLGNWFSAVDQQYRISATTASITSSLVHKLPTEELSAGLASTTRAIQQFDQTHGITKTTASTLAEGADFLTHTIANNNNNNENPSSTMTPPNDQDFDSEGLPTSFQK